MKVAPSREEVLAYVGDATHVALAGSIVADADTPVSAFRKLIGDVPRSFLLESVVGQEHLARYSMFGRADAGLEMIEEVDPVRDPLTVLRERLAARKVWASPSAPRFFGGAVGYVGFDAIAAFEPRVPLPGRHDGDLPACGFLFAEEVYVYDHAARRLHFYALAPLAGDRRGAWDRAYARIERAFDALSTPLAPEPPWDVDEELSVVDLPVRAHRTQPDFEQAVETARQAILEGEAFQVVLSQRFTAEIALEPMLLYRALRAVNPSPYMFLLRFDGFSLVGASPEVLVRSDADGELLVRPIAGTRPRGATPEADRALELELLADEKELAEHRMLLDLGRNDLGRVATPGSVRVAEREHIERYSHVMHVVSDVHAKRAPDLDALDVLRACFPAGTVSGAPKVRACELIAELEPERRGLYAGAVGTFGLQGSMDTCIAIRSLVVLPDRVHLQAGAGIVADSIPSREHDECLAKVRAGLRAVTIAASRTRELAARTDEHSGTSRTHR